MAKFKWRYALAGLPLILLGVGVLNIMMLHSLSGMLQPDLQNDEAAWRTAMRRKHDRPGSLKSMAQVTGSGNAEHLQHETLNDRRRDSTGNAVIFPASSGDRMTSALVLVLRERGLRPNFCRQNLAGCVADSSKKRSAAHGHKASRSDNSLHSSMSKSHISGSSFS